MTKELIIDGQQVDLAPDTDITLEYSSSLFGNIGEVKLAHSYTVKLPRTLRNARVLDAPEAPAHQSEKTRRYLSARYYVNGIDLFGDATAYVMSSGSSDYQVVLLRDTVPGLNAWASSKAKLPDLTGLPVLQWKGAGLATSATTSSSFYARYDSGAWDSPSTPVAPHPCVTLRELVSRIFDTAGVPYTLGDSIDAALRAHVLLVAPSHRPNFEQELNSGARAQRVVWNSLAGKWWFSDWQEGWDSPYEGGSASASTSVRKGTTEDLRILLNVKVTSGAVDTLYLELSHAGVTRVVPSTATGDGGFLIDTTVSLGSELQMKDEADYFGIALRGLTDNGSYTFSAYDPEKPVFALIRPHESISVAHSNSFSISTNLPDIAQLDFIKGLLAIFGAAMVIKGDRVIIESYDNILQRPGAYDWSSKVDMDGGDGIQDLSYQLSGFAQENVIRWEEDEPQPVSPDIVLTVDDGTLSQTRDLLKLPFAASIGGVARHYKCTDEQQEDGSLKVVAEDIDIKPRVFSFYYDSDGVRCLTFPDTLRASGAVAAYMQSYQAAILHPLVLDILVRLDELDLAGLDLTKAVYLRQYGHYYAILTVQTSGRGPCKVKLLQLP